MGEKQTKGIITKAAYEQLLRICKEASPLEACGIVASSNTHSAASHTSQEGIELPIIDFIIPITNIHINPTHAFTFDPSEWTAAYYSMQTSRQSLVGLFHSHPSTEAIPSISDTEGFLPASELSYWIVSLKNSDNPHVQPYRRTQGAFHPVQLVLA